MEEDRDPNERLDLNELDREEEDLCRANDLDEADDERRLGDDRRMDRLELRGDLEEARDLLTERPREAERREDPRWLGAASAVGREAVTNASTAKATIDRTDA